MDRVVVSAHLERQDRAAGLPVGPVQNAQEVFECPQITARQLLIEVDDPVIGPVKLVGPPIKLSNNPDPIRRPAPDLGEHTANILRDVLGYSEEQVAQLKAGGIV